VNVKQDQSTITPAPLPPKVAAIRALIAADYVLIPLYKGKNPGFDGWEETAPGQYGETDLAARNYGVVLKPGDLVVDIDPRNFASGDNPVKRLIEKLGQPLKSWTIKTGGGGYHVYFRKPPDILVRNSLKDFSGIEFKSAGRQMVGPGSIHPDSGKEYVVASGNINEIADAPATLLTLIQRTAVPWADEAGTGTYINDAGTQGRYLDYLTNMAPPSGSFVVACRGRDMGLPPAVTLELMLEVWNPRRSGRKTIEELRVKVEHAYKYARGAVGAAHPSAAFDKIDAPSPPPPLPSPTTKEKDPEIAWNTSPQGKVLKTFQNLLNYMRLPAGGLHKIFAFNEFTGRVEFVNPAPWHRGRLPRYPGVGDDDLKLLKGYLSTRHGYETTVQNIEEAVTNVAYHDRFHPVREYLHGLKWDEKQRLDTWMRDYLGVAETPYTRACARKVLCAAVMRVMHPGIKFDHVLVLEGAQDVGKSTVVELLGGKWAADAPVEGTLHVRLRGFDGGVLAQRSVRVAGAVRSISGTESVRESTYDATTRSARVWVTSRYYDPMKSLAENKEYLATEGRMAAQLALFGNKDVQRVTIALYSRRTLLATVTGRQGDAFDRMTVVYSGPLMRP